jgi:Xaa-Pro dipeptidase
MAYAIPGQVSDHITFLEFRDTDFELLKEAIEECRVIKDEYEIALTLKANEISATAHTAILKAVKHAKNERELEGLFLQQCISGGCREQAYHSIVASGTAAATLHYGKNDQPLEGKLNLLLDAGGEYNCYASDIVSHCSPMISVTLKTPSKHPHRLEHFLSMAGSAKKVGKYTTSFCTCSMFVLIC